ncbi:hypothetical protein ACFX2J_025014 [Malus domestica]
MATDIICPQDRQFKRVSNKIKDDNRYWPYFKGCIGAIDETHVPVVVPREMQGAAHDSRIFMEALRRPELKFPYPPSGKYYLVDAGYPHMNGYIGPYRDQEFQPYDDDDELLPPGHEEDHRDEEIVDENFTHRREMDVERERIANLLISS